jgi:glutamate carboxypeptidase
MDTRKLPDHFRSGNDILQRSISEIVEIESPSFYESGVNEVVDWISERAGSVLTDCSIERVPAEGRGDHLIIRAFQGLPGKPVLILGHTDTVHPRGTKRANPTRVENGRLYGCGTFDMKANIALMLEVFRAIGDLGLVVPRSVNILLTCDEEVGSETGRPLVEQEAKDASYCLVFEPSAAGKVKTGRKGTSVYTLKAHGIAAHAGLDPEKGASAILELSRQIVELEKLNDPGSGTTVTVGTIKGGTTSNVVPAEAECAIDVRFTSMEKAYSIENSIRGLEAFDKRVGLELLGEINRPPMERTEAVAKLFEKARSLANSFGYVLDETQVGGASDGNFVAAAGVPVLDGLGIAGDGAHRIDEHVLVDDIPKRASLLTLLLTTDLKSD